jgi:hypothetical protein
MTDALMKIYLAAKEDAGFLNDVQSSQICFIPNFDGEVSEKKHFAACYTGYLVAKGLWEEFAKAYKIYE